MLAGSGTHRWFLRPPVKLESAESCSELEQSCARTVTLQKEWLGFLSHKHVKNSRKKIASSHQRASLRAFMVCSSGRRILTEAGYSFSKPKHFAVIYFSGWLWKQDLD